MTTPSSPANHAASANPDLEATNFGPRQQPPPPDTVDIPLDVLERTIDDLFAVGLALHAGNRSNRTRHGHDTDPVLERLDRIVARIRQSVLTSTKSHMQPGVPLEAITTRQHQQPDITALSNLTNRELSTIDLLDAAHSATRALIALEPTTGPEARPLVCFTNSP